METRTRSIGSPVTARHAPRLRVLGRVAAALGLVSALAHAAEHLLMEEHTSPTAVSVLMVVMSVACLVCAYHLWNAPTRRTWVASVVMYAAMIVVHLVLAVSVDPEAHPASHGAMTMTQNQGHPGTPWVAILLTTIALIQIWIGTWAVRSTSDLGSSTRRDREEAW